MEAAVTEAERRMTSNELRAALGRLELTQQEAARVLGVDPRTMRRWVLGERPVPRIATHFLDHLEQAKRAG
jgi:DNA-binding transcriptional regulator YiaG